MGCGVELREERSALAVDQQAGGAHSVADLGTPDPIFQQQVYIASSRNRKDDRCVPGLLQSGEASRNEIPRNDVVECRCQRGGRCSVEGRRAEQRATVDLAPVGCSGRHVHRRVATDQGCGGAAGHEGRVEPRRVGVGDPVGRGAAVLVVCGQRSRAPVGDLDPDLVLGVGHGAGRGK